ncbi:MAG: SoxR reducing system RseC family protein [Gammaproteobacteria bacterium]|nr:SoxR reducing system RseC family protein [Gammaproteobacteria bacterium]
MLEENATVIAVEGGHIWVETQARSACAHCGTDSCSTSVIAKLFNVRRNRLKLANSLGARAGQVVVIGIPDEILVAASLRAYLLPLVGLLAAAFLAEALGLDEMLQVLLAGLGLLAGLALMGGGVTGAYQPLLLRLAPTSRMLIPPPPVTRNPQ